MNKGAVTKLTSFVRLQCDEAEIHGDQLVFAEYLSPLKSGGLAVGKVSFCKDIKTVGFYRTSVSLRIWDEPTTCGILL